MVRIRQSAVMPGMVATRAPAAVAARRAAAAPGAARAGDRLCRRGGDLRPCARQGLRYYFAPSYPVLFAAGGVAWETWLKRPFARWAAIAVVAIPNLLLAPIELPILSPDSLVAYQRAIGFSPAAGQTEKMKSDRRLFGRLCLDDAR